MTILPPPVVWVLDSDRPGRVVDDACVDALAEAVAVGAVVEESIVLLRASASCRIPEMVE